MIPLMAGETDLVALLRCPATGSRLVMRDGSLVSTDGGITYPVVHGVPVVIDPQRSLFDPADYVPDREPRPRARVKAMPKALVRRLLAHLPKLGRNLAAHENLMRLLGLLRARASGARSLVLVVGSGDLGVGMEALLGASDVDLVQTDVALSENVSVICDGHDLPFADATFDAVVCQAVLEHVLEPQRVADEIWRVLKPAGLVYSEVPFMQQVHAGAFDFTRFTPLGHRRLWRMFDELASGADSGPGMALAWSIMYFTRACISRRAWRFVGRLLPLVLFWLKYFDRWLVRRPQALDAVSGSFFLGARRETPLDDRTIVAGYRGTDDARLQRVGIAGYN